MKLRIHKQDLAKHIGIVQKAVSGRTPMPILEGILMECSNNHLKLTGSDGEISIETRVDAFIEEEGSIVIGSRIFGDIVRKLPNAMISIETEGTNMRITCEKSEFNILGQNTREYPNLPVVEEVNSVTINGEKLKAGIRSTEFAVSLDDIRPALTGVLMDMEKDKVSFVALDGYRMALKPEQVTNEAEREAIVPSRSFNELMKIMEDDTEEVTLVFSHNHMSADLGDTVFYTKLINGDYFNYEGLIRREHTKTVTVNRTDFLNSLERASLLAKEERANLVKLNIKDNEILIESNSDIGDVHELVACEKEGEDLKIAFNSKYLIEGIRTIPTEKILLQFTDAINPCIIEPKDGEKYIYLVLPVRLAN